MNRPACLYPRLTRVDNTSVAASATQLPPPPPGYGCSGCVIQAYAPRTYAFAESESSSWTSVVKTERPLTQIISYFTGTPATLETVVTKVETLNQTFVFTDASHEVITHTTPVFTVEPTPGVQLELPAGTYLFYDEIYGGLNDFATATTKAGEFVTIHPHMPTAQGHARVFAQDSGAQPTCAAAVKSLQDAKPTRTEEWRYFFQSVTGALPSPDATVPTSLPPALLSYLNQNPQIKKAFGFTDLKSCTPITPVHSTVLTRPPTTGVPYPSNSPTHASSAAGLSSASEGPVPIGSTARTTGQSTYIATTYQPTAIQTTVYGCLRCDTSSRSPPVQTRKQSSAGGEVKGSQHTVKPNVSPPGAGQMISIGTNTYTIHPAKPSNGGQGFGHGQNVVVGTVTLSPGATAFINSVLIAVPSSGAGSVVVIGTNTYQVLPTSPPVLKIGDATLAPNSLGQYVVGTQTLLPGGPAITVNDFTVSLAGDGSRAVINGVTSTLGLGPLTAAPDITIAGSTYSATVRDGTTEYVLGPGTTLRPGDVITISGTTYSLDALNTALIVNGKTSTMPKGPATNSATPTPSVSVTGSTDDDGKSGQTAARTSSKGNAVSMRRESLDIWIESFVIGLASWVLMFI